jgi:hypothetical protein
MPTIRRFGNVDDQKVLATDGLSVVGGLVRPLQSIFRGLPARSVGGSHVISSGVQVKSVRNATSYRDSLLTGKSQMVQSFDFEHKSLRLSPKKKSCVLGNTWALRRLVAKGPPRDFQTIRLSRRKYVPWEEKATRKYCGSHVIVITVSRVKQIILSERLLAVLTFSSKGHLFSIMITNRFTARLRKGLQLACDRLVRRRSKGLMNYNPLRKAGYRQ